jgi:hypothetical protein
MPAQAWRKLDATAPPQNAFAPDAHAQLLRQLGNGRLAAARGLISS